MHLCLWLTVEQIQITVQPQPQHALEGSRVVLSCKGSGPPTLGYQWFKGKEEVSGKYIVNTICIIATLSQYHVNIIHMFYCSK